MGQCQLCGTRSNDLIKLSDQGWSLTVCPDCFTHIQIGMAVYTADKRLKMLLEDLQEYPKTESSRHVVWTTTDVASDANIGDFIRNNWTLCVENQMTTRELIIPALYEQNEDDKNIIADNINAAIKELYPDGMHVIVKSELNLWNHTRNAYLIRHDVDASIFFRNFTCDSPDDIELYVDEDKNVVLAEMHHDGTNTNTFYVIRPDALDSLDDDASYETIIKDATVSAYELFRTANLVD